jgi:hypothetical protein
MMLLMLAWNTLQLIRRPHSFHLLFHKVEAHDTQCTFVPRSRLNTNLFVVMMNEEREQAQGPTRRKFSSETVVLFLAPEVEAAASFITDPRIHQHKEAILRALLHFCRTLIFPRKLFRSLPHSSSVYCLRHRLTDKCI